MDKHINKSMFRDVEIFDKTYSFDFLDDYTIRLYLTTRNDVRRFYKWYQSIIDESNTKKDYVKDLKFTTPIEKGTFYSSVIYRLELNGNCIDLKYEYKKSELDLEIRPKSKSNIIQF